MRAVACSTQNLTTTSTRTMLAVTAPAARTIKPTQLEISFAGITAAAAPIEVQLLRQTTAGTGTAVTPVAMAGTTSGSIESTALEDHSAEPTAGDILRKWFVHPQGGSLIYTVPEPDKWETGEAGRLALRVITPGASVNCLATIEFEE